MEWLREKDNLVAGVQVASLLGLAGIGTFAARIYSGEGSLKAPLLLSAASALLAKFYGGAYKHADSIWTVFTKYVPRSFELTRSVMGAPKSDRRGVWLGTGRDVTWSQFYNEGLANGIGKLLEQKGLKTVYDFGCGHNRYAEFLSKQKIEATGLDGNDELAKGGHVMQANIANSFNIAARDCVMSIEVGAKIPKMLQAGGEDFCLEDQFITNILNHAKNLIIISWPIPGQKGANQHNPQTNNYIIQRFKELGKGREWDYNPTLTEQLKLAANPVHYWFQNTIMVLEPRVKID